MLCLEGVSSNDLNNVLDYIYNGETQIFQDNLDRFLDVAQRFKLEGLIADQTLKDEERYVEEGNQTKVDGRVLNLKNDLKSESFVNNAVENVNSLETKLISADFSNIEELNIRIEDEIIVEAPGVYKCARCPKTYNKRFNLKEHIEVHFEGLSFPCQLCGKDFRLRKNFRRHKH